MSGPARQPRPASSAPATSREPSARSNANRRWPLVRRRAERRDRALVRCGFVRRAGGSGSSPPFSEEADAVRGPVGGEGFADNPRSRDRPPEPAVVGEVTVVAHHEVVTGRNGERPRVVAVSGLGGAPGEARVGLPLALAVED